MRSVRHEVRVNTAWLTCRESKDRIKAGLDPDVPFDDKVVLSADKKEQIKHMTDNHVALLETFRKKQSVKAPEQK